MSTGGLTSLLFISRNRCAVCGLLKQSCELSDLKNVKNLLHILQQEGVTCIEHKTENKKVHEYSGPVLDYSCSKICNNCRMSVRKGKVPCLALANGLWLGKVPDELKSLHFVEKLLIARVHHTCCYVKVVTTSNYYQITACTRVQYWASYQ